MFDEVPAVAAPHQLPQYTVELGKGTFLCHFEK